MNLENYFKFSWLALLRPVIGPENSRHSLNQSDAKVKPITPCSLTASSFLLSPPIGSLCYFPLLWLAVVIIWFCFTKSSKFWQSRCVRLNTSSVSLHCTSIQIFVFHFQDLFWLCFSSFNFSLEAPLENVGLFMGALVLSWSRLISIDVYLYILTSPFVILFFASLLWWTSLFAARWNMQPITNNATTTILQLLTILQCCINATITYN